MKRIFFALTLLLLSIVIGLMASKQCTLRCHRAPMASSPILRTADTPSLIPTAVESEPLPSYPWENPGRGKISPITKDYFRCRGSDLSPPVPVVVDGKVIENIFDCHGASSHSLPIRHEKEFIYPILIELMNEIQSATGKPVIITSGHRCPTHNRYVDPDAKTMASKHQIGAEVAFYVAGLENNPDVVLNTIFAFYRSTPRYASEGKEYMQFERYDKETDVSTKPWMNKEILVKLFLPHEGHNADNRHPFPYISIQVRFDRETNMRVAYSPADAQNFLRR